MHTQMREIISRNLKILCKKRLSFLSFTSVFHFIFDCQSTQNTVSQKRIDQSLNSMLSIYVCCRLVKCCIEFSWNFRHIFMIFLSFIDRVFSSRSFTSSICHSLKFIIYVSHIISQVIYQLHIFEHYHNSLRMNNA